MPDPSDPVRVQYGCGFSTGRDWLNFDSSPTLRLERLPVVGGVLGRMAGNSQPFPAEVRYGDICKGLPIAPGSARAVYASHVLEHLSYDDFRIALRNTLNMLCPGGEFRLIVPDLQARARIYLDALAGGKVDANSDFMTTTYLGLRARPRSLLGKIRLMVGGSQHLWMWDEPSMRAQLEDAGFERVTRCRFGDSADPAFAQVEDEGRFVDAGLGIDELAMSAFKPDGA